ncbi:MAG TPA: DUF2332 domain-containing protein [Acidimicrobiales bacterium]
MSDSTSELGKLWEWFADEQCRGYSPLYERICRAVATQGELLELVQGAPPAAHMPTVLLGAVHYLLLAGLEHPLADVYSGSSDRDPAPLFVEVCREHRDQIGVLLATRHTQTNDCGRSAVIGPALTWLGRQCDEPLALVDVGASAGLTLLCDRYRFDYGRHGTTGPHDSPVRIDCRVVGGDPPIAAHLPALVDRVGVDRDPVDLADPDDARWLLACVWPDTGRLERTAAAIALALAQGDLPPVVEGYANDVLPAVLGQLPGGATVAVLTTWAFAYFSIEDRHRFTELLTSESHGRRITWLSAEGTGTVEAFAGAAVAHHDDSMSSVLGAVTFEDGAARAQLLGFVHQHGNWIDWRAP